MEENIMNLKKILTGVVAGAMAVSAMAVGAFAVNVEGAPKTLETAWGSQWCQFILDGATKEDYIGYTVTFNVKSECAYDADNNMVGKAYSSGQIDGKNIDLVTIMAEEGKTEYTASFEITEENIDAIWAEESWGQRAAFQFQCGHLAPIELVSVTAEKAEPDDPKPEGLETVLVVQDNKTWATVKSEKVNVAIGNEYTYSLTGLDIEPSTLTVMYIKDVAAMDLPEGTDPEASKIDPVKVTFTSVKINGKDITVKEGMSTGLDKNGIFDFALYNTWGTSYIDLPEENINTVEIAIKVEAAEIPEETTSEETEAPETEASATEASATEASATEVTTGAGTTAPADDKNQPTGIALAVIPAVVAAAGVIVAKKRK